MFFTADYYIRNRILKKLVNSVLFLDIMSSKPTLTVKPRPPGTTAGKPPPKPKKPENFKFLRAQFAFIATDEDELSFNEGDLLYILDDKSDPDWWKARVKVCAQSTLIYSMRIILPRE